MISAASRPRPELSRRHFLGHLAATALGIPAHAVLLVAARPTPSRSARTTRSCIVLWMSGGPSHLDIWDLKPDSEKNGGPFRPIDTSAPGVKISEHLPKVAKQMHHLNIIRSLDSKEGNHDRGTYLMHTGYAPNPTVVHPGFGSIAAYELGEQLKNFDLPHCIAINEPGHGGRLPGDVVLAVRGPEPQRPDRQPEAARGRRRAADRPAAPDARPGRERVHRPAPQPDGRRSQGGLRQDDPDDELAASKTPSTSRASPPRSARPTATARSARAA